MTFLVNAPDTALADDRVSPTDATQRVRNPAPPEVLRVGYRVRLVRTPTQLEDVVRLRMEGYSKRLPEWANALTSPEPEDTQPGTFLFVAYRLSDGMPVGTSRILTNIEIPVELECNVSLPPSFDGKLLAQGGRLAVVAGPDNILVVRLLMKSMHACCRALEAAHVLVAAESPRDRFFRAFGFRDVFPGRKFLVPSAMRHAVAVMYFDMDRTNEFLEFNPGHLKFLKTYCPDIQTFSSLFASWITPRNS
jgi:hypothetical protein